MHNIDQITPTQVLNILNTPAEDHKCEISLYEGNNFNNPTFTIYATDYRSVGLVTQSGRWKIHDVSRMLNFLQSVARMAGEE